MRAKLLIAAWLAASLWVVAPRAQSPEVLRIQGTSRVLIQVGKAGAFGFAGHPHEVEAPVTGTVTLDRSDLTRSEVVLEFATASLRVTGKGEPAQDVAEVQRVMLSDRVLDVKRYSTIVFRSRRITGGSSSSTSFTVSVTGDLSLHGETRPVVVPVRVTVRGDSLTAEGTASLKQTDFGIQPVTAAGGTVRVKDELQVAFNLQAAR